MSYQYPPPNQPPYGAYGQPPQGGYQQQYGAPQGPPQGHYPPQQGQYGQPPPSQGGYHGAPSPQPPVGYGAPPPSGYHAPSPQPPTGYGAPPPNGPPPAGYHGHSPQPSYGGPPPAGYGAPSPQPPVGYGAPPPGAPPQGGYHHAPSPQPGFNQPPPFAQGSQGHAPPPGQPPLGGPGMPGAPVPPGVPGPNSFAGPSMPSLGYTPGQKAPGDFRREADVLRKAMKGFGTDEAAMIGVLARLDPLQVAAVRASYSQHIGRDLYKDVKSEAGGYLRQGLLAVIEGPLGHDVECAHESVDGMGTKEWMMNEALLGRSNADMNAIRIAYEHKYHRKLHMDIADDLSFKTSSLFKHIISARRTEESVPPNPEEMKMWATIVYEKRDMDRVCEIFGRASNAQLRALDHECHAKWRTSLLGVIMDKYSGHMQDTLWFMAQGASDPAMRDAILLEQAMDGAGTKDERLVVRIVRIHWNRDHKEQVKRAYRHKYHKDLIDRVRGETSGDYQNLMCALLQ
ncbi:hypothetical protein N7478_010328 [Penicillium angulare]|uniref:uncharacterized protein n=1 Tax=Penicillium angulare TaxID=116970 RepID=UPI0025425F16|nr:uncharacterized protein N7478_010328 [Penicillium angulare]KAJ5267520.1 hypothetical protein N7478_010328 [Penicillium angulare]